MKLKTLIVDDEHLARENLEMLLNEHCSQSVEVIGKASCIDEAESLIEETSPDLLFLDIRMPSGLEGFDLLEKIDTSHLLVVFVTAFKDYAIQAFNANAAHYLMKPLDIDDLISTVKKVEKLNANRKTVNSELIDNLVSNLRTNTIDKIAVHHSQGIKLIEVSSIIRIEGEGNYSAIFIDEEPKYLDTRTLKTYASLLSNEFMRIHKSHIINLNRVKEYVHSNGHRVILSNGDEVPISRNKLSEFLTFLKIYH